MVHGKGLPSAREKTLGKAGFAGRRKAVCVSPSATLGDFFAECFPAFAESLALGKVGESDSGGI